MQLEVVDHKKFHIKKASPPRMDQNSSLNLSDVRLLQDGWGGLSGFPLNNRFKRSDAKGCYGYIWIQFALIFLCLHASPLTCCIMVGNGIQVCSQQLSCCLCNVLLLPPSTWGPLTYVLICLKKVFKKYLPIDIDWLRYIYTLSTDFNIYQATFFGTRMNCRRHRFSLV